MSGPAPADVASVGNSTMAEETNAAEAMAAATEGGQAGRAEQRHSAGRWAGRSSDGLSATSC